MISRKKIICFYHNLRESISEDDKLLLTFLKQKYKWLSQLRSSCSQIKSSYYLTLHHITYQFAFKWLRKTSTPRRSATTASRLVACASMHCCTKQNMYFKYYFTVVRYFVGNFLIHQKGCLICPATEVK